MTFYKRDKQIALGFVFKKMQRYDVSIHTGVGEKQMAGGDGYQTDICPFCREGEFRSELSYAIVRDFERPLSERMAVGR